MIKGLAFVALATLAFAAVACGGDDGSGLPAAGEQRFTVTGTMEVRFLQEGVSADPIALQETETGEVSGSLTAVFNDDGSFSIPELGLTAVFDSDVVTISQADEPSTGNVTEDGTTLSLNVGVALNFGEPAFSETPIELESDDKLGVDPMPGFSLEDTDPGFAFATFVFIENLIIHIRNVEDVAAAQTALAAQTESAVSQATANAQETQEAEETMPPPEPTSPPAATATPPSSSGATLDISCEHTNPGVFSELIVRVSGLSPGQTISGVVSGPPSGLKGGPASIIGPADSMGNVEFRVTIFDFVEYEVNFMSEGLSGSFTVGDVCPG